MYDSAVGRFLSADPMHEFATPYSYVGSSPINAIDPTGMERVHSGQSTNQRNPEHYDTFAGMDPHDWTYEDGSLPRAGDYARGGGHGSISFQQFVEDRNGYQYYALDYNNPMINEITEEAVGPGINIHHIDPPYKSSASSGTSDPTVYGWAFTSFVAGARGAKNVLSNEIIRQEYINMKAAGVQGPVEPGIKVPKSLKLVGKFGGVVFAAWGAVDIEQQYQSGEMNSYWRGAEQIANGAGAIPVIGTGLSIGWELGRWITQIQWYQETIHGKYYPPTIDKCITCPK
jgi:hypothetical protein